MTGKHLPTANLPAPRLREDEQAVNARSPRPPALITFHSALSTCPPSPRSPTFHFRTLALSTFLLLSSLSFASSWSSADKAFAKGDYAKALEQYYKARTDAPDSRLLNFNIGSTLYKLGRYDEAKTELGQAIHAADTNTAKQATYNLANVQYRLGAAAKEPAEKIAAWREGIALLKKAVDLDPKYDNAKRNAEFIQRKLKEELDKQKKNQDKKDDKKQEQKPLSEVAKQALARALQLCRQGQYPEAKGLLEQTIQNDESASSLSPYVQRMQDLIDISEGREPTKPIDTSNNNQDLEVI
jgi:tetratricopeptide (TPR) repeat protein